jgi:hypothetical protein
MMLRRFPARSEAVPSLPGSFRLANPPRPTDHLSVDATGYIWKAVVRINNQSRHIVKDIEFRILGDPRDVTTVKSSHKRMHPPMVSSWLIESLLLQAREML